MRVALLGVGLIGGSIGLAVRERLDAEVVGFEPDPGGRDRALELGAIDSAADSLEAAVAGTDVVFCASPVGTLAATAVAAIAASEAGTAITDVGSTKLEIVERVGAHEHAERFIGGHPLAGAETAGVGGARADLFEGARWFLTPTAGSSGLLFDRLHGVIAGIGARPQAIDADEHDRVMATISHLPHVVANVLVARAAASLGPSERRPDVGRSFRDATRVAGANPAIWADIFSSNSEALAAEVDELAAMLGEAAERLRASDARELRSWQREAADARDSVLAQQRPEGTAELRLVVENRPGVVAEIALALGRAGVNIEDMSLYPAPDRSTGSISLWIAGSGEADRAAAVVAGLGHVVEICTDGGGG